MPRNISDTGPGATLFVTGVLAGLLALRIPLDYDGSWGARVFPLMSAAALVLLGGLMLRPTRKTTTDQGPIPRGPFVLLGLVVLYLWMIGKFGYMFSTGLVAPAALWLFGIRNPLGIFFGALAAPVVFHLIFFKFLGVFPPYGAWFDLLDMIGG